MAQACASCGTQNDDDLTVCFSCGEQILPSIRLGQLIASRYEILSQLGRGGMGAVYRAHDRVLDEEVALKVLREGGGDRSDATRRFRTEIKLARRVIHRNVCRIFEYGEEQGRRFISMELIQGSELKRHAGAMTPDQAFAVAVQIVDGLEAIHRVGVIHRDLKTSNIMLDPSGTVRLMDFGIAKHVTQDAVGATATGHIVGTPSYMSPEQARAEKLDFRSDIYSLGVVLYELFTGRVPFEGDTPVAVILKHIHDPPPLTGSGTEKLPPSVVPVLARALAKSRAERFQTAAELGQALRAAAGESFALPSAVGERALAMGGPSGPTLPAERIWRGTTQVQEQTQDGTAATIGLPPTQVAAEPTVKRTVALRDKARLPKDRTSPALAIGIGAALVIAILLVARPWGSIPVTVEPTPAVSPSAAPVAAARSVVTFNALPWARINLKPRGPADSLPPVAEGLITPCTVELVEGAYTIELENGGLTPPLRREIRVAAGAQNEFVFTMPSFDPARAAQSAVENRP